MVNEYKLTAPSIDFLLDFFEDGFTEPVMPSKELSAAMDQLFDVLHDLAPSDKNSKEKSIWIKIPRGTIENYVPYEDMVKWGEVKTREEYEELWKQDYPDPVSWYKLIVGEAFHGDGTLWFKGVWLDGRAIVNPWVDQKEPRAEEAAIKLCTMITMAAEKAMEKVREGTYNDEVRAFLPDHVHLGITEASADGKGEPVWEKGTKSPDRHKGENHVFRRGALARNTNYNILCRWLAERVREKNDQYTL